MKIIKQQYNRNTLTSFTYDSSRQTVFDIQYVQEQYKKVITDSARQFLHI